MPSLINTREALHQLRQSWHRTAQRVALVPTMGNLHQGHLSLVEAARKRADRVVVSIFVNPTQFGPQEDFARYPRTLQQDLEQLRPLEVDAVFTPDESMIYPHGTERSISLSAPAALSNTLCGLTRPGHFDGVVMVVSRLFNLVQPDLATFGEKDYQQLLIIEHMTRDLGYPTRILRCPTLREANGLAMSSRNQYLNAEQRQRATALNRALRDCAGHLNSDSDIDYQQLEQAGMQQLRDAQLAPEYFSIRRAADLQSPRTGQSPQAASQRTAAQQTLRVLAAARLGATRLIDNLAVSNVTQAASS